MDTQKGPDDIKRFVSGSEGATDSFQELPAGREVRLFDAASNMNEGEIAFPVKYGGTLTLLNESGIKQAFPRQGRIARVETLTPNQWEEVWRGIGITPPKSDSTFCKILYVADNLPLGSSTQNTFWVEVLAES